MIAKLPDDLAAALRSQDEGRLEVVDPDSNRIYYLIDAETLNALEAKGDHDAIAAGIADMEAGRGMPAEQADKTLRERLGFPKRQT